MNYAENPSVCTECKKPILVGDPIVKVTARSTRHETLTGCNTAGPPEHWDSIYYRPAALARVILRSYVARNACITDPPFTGKELGSANSRQCDAWFQQCKTAVARRTGDPTPVPGPAPIEPQPQPEPVRDPAPIEPAPAPAPEPAPVDPAAAEGFFNAVFGPIMQRIDALEKAQSAQIDTDALEAYIRERIEAATVKIHVTTGDPAVPIMINGDEIYHPMFRDAFNVLQDSSNLWICDPLPGSGKTHAAEQMHRLLDAASRQNGGTGVRYFVLSAATLAYDTIGYKDVQGNHVKTAVTAWALYEGDAVLLLDEIDSWQKPAQAAANMLFAGNKTCLPGYVDANGDPENFDTTHGGKYRKYVIATSNTIDGTGVGFQREALDLALRSRFRTTVDWPLHHATESAIAVRAAAAKGSGDRALVAAVLAGVNASRQVITDKGLSLLVGPRQTYTAVELTVAGNLSPEFIGKYTVAGQELDKADQEQVGEAYAAAFRAADTRRSPAGVA